MEIIESTWESPSNIALVKYWGKKGLQLPANPSISITLSDVVTRTQVVLKEKKTSEKWECSLYLDKKPKPEFLPKILAFFNKAAAAFPWLQEYHIEINTHNNFPHGTGIASSASSMSALALCICDLDYSLKNIPFNPDALYNLASYWSRMGSGSACRSVYGGYVSWGEHPNLPMSSDEYATPLSDYAALFNQIHDAVLIIDDTEKQVSSTQGHQMLQHHPFASSRYEQARNNTGKLVQALKSGNIAEMGAIVEEEALSLHAMMLTSNPGFFLIKPNTLLAINEIQNFRNHHGIPVYFTLDAGPNIHLLYHNSDASSVEDWIQTKLKPLCKNEQILFNQVGNGPQKL